MGRTCPSCTSVEKSRAPIARVPRICRSRSPPEETVELSLDTSSNPRLRPHDPSARFRVGQADDLVVLDENFQLEGGGPHVVRAVHKGPVRIGRGVAVNIARDTRGSLYVEYAVLYALVGFVIAMCSSLSGPRVVRQYSEQRNVLYQPTP